MDNILRILKKKIDKFFFKITIHHIVFYLVSLRITDVSTILLNGNTTTVFLCKRWYLKENVFLIKLIKDYQKNPRCLKTGLWTVTKPFHCYFIVSTARYRRHTKLKLIETKKIIECLHLTTRVCAQNLVTKSIATGEYSYTKHCLYLECIFRF